jgi:hypothetical protein
VIIQRKNLSAKLGCLYGAKLGCLLAIHVSISKEVTLDRVILEGAENVSFGIFNPIMTKIVPKIEGKIVQKVVKGEAKLLIKMMGMQKYSPEMLAQLIYIGSSEKSLENATIVVANSYSRDIKKIAAQPGKKVACWYGFKEKKYAKCC